MLPGARAGPHKHGEDLLAGPKLERLEQRGRRQVHRVARIAHVRRQRRRLRACIETVAARHQERAGQEVLSPHSCQVDPFVQRAFGTGRRISSPPTARLMQLWLEAHGAWARLLVCMQHCFCNGVGFDQPAMPMPNARDIAHTMVCKVPASIGAGGKAQQNKRSEKDRTVNHSRRPYAQAWPQSAFCILV